MKSQQVKPNFSPASAAVATVADSRSIVAQNLSAVLTSAVLLSVILGGIISDLSLIGLIQILPILISGLIINLILIIQ